jgi:hypothetical protein
MTPEDSNRDPREQVRTEIREFLSTRRARITPQQAGLPSFGGDRRRVPGLRREEVATLAGVSPQYYIRLERGDATSASNAVMPLGRRRASSMASPKRCALMTPNAPTSWT